MGTVKRGDGVWRIRLTKEALVGKLCCRGWSLLSFDVDLRRPGGHDGSWGRHGGDTSARYVEPSGSFYLVSHTMDGRTQGPNLQMLRFRGLGDGDANEDTGK
jgi:hypothetical protein